VSHPKNNISHNFQKKCTKGRRKYGKTQTKCLAVVDSAEECSRPREHERTRARGQDLQPKTESSNKDNFFFLSQKIREKKLSISSKAFTKSKHPQNSTISKPQSMGSANSIGATLALGVTS